MAIIEEPSEEARAGWKAWVAERPDRVRAVAERFEPWRLYHLKSSGHRVVLTSFNEHADGRVTLRVDVLARFNALAFERNVFGVDPDDLEECDLPAPSEPVGAAIPQEDVQAFTTDQLKAVVEQIRSLERRGPIGDS